MAANLLAEQGRYGEAEETLSQRLDHSPGDATSLVERAHVRCRMRRFAECRSDLEAAVRSDPSPTVAMNVSVVAGRAVPTATDTSERNRLMSLLASLSRRRFPAYEGLSAEIALHRLQGESLLANGEVRAAVQQLRAASALDPSGELREPLAHALQAYAASQTDPAAKNRLLQEALAIRLPFTESPARIWVHSQLYPPGTYADNLEETVRLAKQLAQPKSIALATELAELRPPPR